MWDSERDTARKNRLLDSMGEGEGGMIWENSIKTCILHGLCKAEVTHSNAHREQEFNVRWWWRGSESDYGEQEGVVTAELEGAASTQI